MDNIKQFRKDELEDLIEQNYARKVAGLPLLKVTIRTCMVCGSRFESTGKRICCNPDVPYMVDVYSINEYK